MTSSPCFQFTGVATWSLPSVGKSPTTAAPHRSCGRCSSDNGADAKTEQTDSAGQVRAIQTLYSLQRAIDNGPDRKIKHEKSS